MMSEAQLEHIQREYWFHYFNQYLLSKGLITEEQVHKVEKYLNDQRFPD